MGGGPGREGAARKAFDTDSELAVVGIGTDRIASPDVGTIDVGPHGHVLSGPIGEVLRQFGRHVEGDGYGFVGQRCHLGDPEPVETTGRSIELLEEIERLPARRADHQGLAGGRAELAHRSRALAPHNAGKEPGRQRPGGAIPISARSRRPVALIMSVVQAGE